MEELMSTDLARLRHIDMDELLHRDHYTPDELANLLGVSAHLVRHAAREKELRAYIVGHDVVSIRREDVIAWLEARRGA
jgi:excisionase family DNA binding protein